MVNWRDPWHRLAGGSERYAWEFALALRDAGRRRRVPDRPRRAASHAGETRDGIRVRRRGGALHLLPARCARLLGRGCAAAARRRHRPGLRHPVFTPLLVRRRTPCRARGAPRPPGAVPHLLAPARRRPRPVPRAPADAAGLPATCRRSRSRESTVAEMRAQLGWRGPVGSLAQRHRPAAGSRDVGTPGEPRPGRRARPAGRRTSGSTSWSAPCAARAHASDRRCRSTSSGRARAARRSRTWSRSSGSATAVDRSTASCREDDKARVLAGARLHVCASDAEGWGQVVIEAAAHGVPTLARDVPGLRGLGPGRRDRVAGRRS